MAMDETKMPADPADRLDVALRALFSQSRPPQDLRRLFAAALQRAADEGYAAAVQFVEDNVVAGRASND
jgi:hypothetical protein